MSTLCGGSGLEISNLKNYNFKPHEIKSFYYYFKKISNGKDSIDYLQFKRSLGVLGYNEDKFICKRLFDLIIKENSERVRKFN